MLKFTAEDVRGAVIFAPTPATPDGSDWNVNMSVDLKRTEELYDLALNNGVAGLALCGTAGENAALLWEEKVAYVDCVVQTANKRGYVFAGATGLGTKETIRQMRALYDLGVDGAFVGLPLWQTPTIEDMNAWWKDLAEACPDIPIMIYSNSNFFKTSFTNEFWQGVGKYGKTVVTNKVSYQSNDFVADMDAAPQVQFLLMERRAYDVARQDPKERIKCAWSHDPIVTPNALKAFLAEDSDRFEEIQADIRTLPAPTGGAAPATPPTTAEVTDTTWLTGVSSDFAHYNAQQVRQQWNAQKTLPNVGPARPPYRHYPEERKAAIETWGKAKDEINKKYGVQLAK
jgi:trans-o-hydroxybenzylidenepyruvate hydratase-aldolase